MKVSHVNMKEEAFAPNPTGDQDRGWAIVAVCWALVLFALVSTILRIYIRARLTRNLGSDDAVIGVAMVYTASNLQYEAALTWDPGYNHPWCRPHHFRSPEWSRKA